MAVVLGDGQAEFFGAGFEVLVVVAALPGGVLDAAGVGQGVGGFVQDRSIRPPTLTQDMPAGRAAGNPGPGGSAAARARPGQTTG